MTTSNYTPGISSEIPITVGNNENRLLFTSTIYSKLRVNRSHQKFNGYPIRSFHQLLRFIISNWQYSIRHLNEYSAGDSQQVKPEAGIMSNKAIPTSTQKPIFFELWYSCTRYFIRMMGNIRKRNSQSIPKFTMNALRFTCC